MDIKNFGNVRADVGWICPKCGRVMGPFMNECFYCNMTEVTAINPCTTTSPTVSVDLNKVRSVADTTSIDNSTIATGTTTAKMNTDDAAAATNEKSEKGKYKDELLDAISEAESFDELLNAFTECLFPGIHDKE